MGKDRDDRRLGDLSEASGEMRSATCTAHAVASRNTGLDTEDQTVSLGPALGGSDSLTEGLTSQRLAFCATWVGTKKAAARATGMMGLRKFNNLGKTGYE